MLPLIAILLSSCSAALQTNNPNGKSMNLTVSIGGKQAITGMSSSAGNIEGNVSDNTEPVKQAVAAAIGIETVSGATRAAIAKTNADKATAISAGRNATAVKRIEVGGEVKKQAFQNAQ